MALQFQLANTPSYTDQPFYNYSGSDIPAFVAVSVDAVNTIGTNPNYGLGIVPVAASGNIVIGVTMEIIKANSYGRVRAYGPIAQTSCDGAVTAGTVVDASATASRIGFAKAHVAGKFQLGVALSTGIDLDPVIVMLIGGNNA